MRNVVLDNGISIAYYPMPNTHSVTIGLYIKAGSAYEVEEMRGATHFLEHLQFRRLGNMSMSELYYRMESIGSTLEATTYKDCLMFYMKVVPGKFRECADIFMNLFESVEWADQEFEQEKQVVLDQIIEREMYWYPEDDVNEMIFRNHPLSKSIMGDSERVESLSKERMITYKEDIFANSRLLVCVTGNVSEEQCGYLENALRVVKIRKNRLDLEMPVPRYFQKRKPDIFFVNQPGAPLLTVNLSFDILYDSKDKDLIAILNCILGSGTGSRIQQKIREEKGYTSDIYSAIEWYEKMAVLHIRFSVRKKVFMDCMTELMDIISGMKCSINKKDLDVSLPFFVDNQIFLEDDTKEMNFEIGYNKIMGIDLCPVDYKNDENTIELLHKLAVQIFKPENMSVVVMGSTSRMTKKSIRELIR